MEFIEADPLPVQCWHCVDEGREDCDECDFMAARWAPSPADQLRSSQIRAEKKRLLARKREQARRRRKQKDTV